MHVVRLKSKYEKATYCVIPVIWPYGKGKTIETVKGSMVAGIGRRGKDEQMEHRRNYSVWYCNAGYMISCIYQTHSVIHKEWTL